MMVIDWHNAEKNVVDDDLTNFVKDRLIGQKELTNALSELLSTKEVNREVVREAMTGNQKFKEPLPKANYILKFDEKGKSNYVKIDEKYALAFSDIKAIRVAVDKELVQDFETSISNAKEIAFFPPMTGG